MFSSMLQDLTTTGAKKWEIRERKNHGYMCKGITPTTLSDLVMIIYPLPIQTRVPYNQPNLEYMASLGAKT